MTDNKRCYSSKKKRCKGKKGALKKTEVVCYQRKKQYSQPALYQGSFLSMVLVSLTEKN